MILLIVKIAQCTFALQKDKHILNSNDYFDVTFATDVTDNHTNYRKKYFEEWVSV